MMCEFCKRLEEWKISDEYSDGGIFKREYSTALVITALKANVYSGQFTSYKDGYEGFKLNFCPECGKDLRPSQKFPRLRYVLCV